jgi:hypothetical protein
VKFLATKLLDKKKKLTLYDHINNFFSDYHPRI